MKPPSSFASMGVGLAVCTPGVAILPVAMDKVQVDCVLNFAVVQWCIRGLGLNSEGRCERGGTKEGGGGGDRPGPSSTASKSGNCRVTTCV